MNLKKLKRRVRVLEVNRAGMREELNALRRRVDRLEAALGTETPKSEVVATAGNSGGEDVVLFECSDCSSVFDTRSDYHEHMSNCPGVDADLVEVAMCDAKLGDWICDMVKGHEGIHFAPGLGPFQTTNDRSLLFPGIGVQCKLPRDHDGNHYSRLATDENVSPHPSERKYPPKTVADLDRETDAADL